MKLLALFIPLLLSAQVHIEHGLLTTSQKDQERYEKDFARREKHRTDLIWAASSRLLTPDEMQEVRISGTGLFQGACPDRFGCHSPDEAVINKMFLDLLLQQFTFQAIAAKPCKEPSK